MPRIYIIITSFIPPLNFHNTCEQGIKYEIGDFNVKVGSILLGNASKGVIVEVREREREREAPPISALSFSSSVLILNPTILLNYNTFKVEYCPCVIPNACTAILNQFISSLGPFSSPIPSSVPYPQPMQLPKYYSMQHTTYQYISLFQALKYFKS